MASRTTPTSVKVFGILNTIFGTISLLSVLNSLTKLEQIQQVYKQFPALAKLGAWMPIQMLISSLMAIVLLSLGIGLLKRQPWARSLSVYYAIFVIGFGLLNLAITLTVLGGKMTDPMTIGVIVGTVFGICIGSIYYGLMIYFLTRPEVKAALE
jgi:hypothetical protein